MLKKATTSALFACAVIISCNKDNDSPTTITLFTMTIEATVDRAGNDDWFVVVDHGTGDVIDYKNVKPGQTIKFESGSIYFQN